MFFLYLNNTVFCLNMPLHHNRNYNPRPSSGPRDTLSDCDTDNEGTMVVHARDVLSSVVKRAKKRSSILYKDVHIHTPNKAGRCMLESFKRSLFVRFLLGCKFFVLVGSMLLGGGTIGSGARICGCGIGWQGMDLGQQLGMGGVVLIGLQ